MLSPVAWAPAPLPSPECCTLTTSAFTAIDQSARVAVGRQEQSSSRRLAVSQPGWDLRPGHSATAVKTTTAAYAHPWRVHRVPDVLEGHVGRPEGQPCTGLHRLRTSAGQRCPRRGRGLQPGHWRSTCSVITESMLDTAWYQTSTSGLSMLQTPPPPWQLCQHLHTWWPAARRPVWPPDTEACATKNKYGMHTEWHTSCTILHLSRQYKQHRSPALHEVDAV